MTSGCIIEDSDGLSLSDLNYQRVLTLLAKPSAFLTGCSQVQLLSYSVPGMLRKQLPRPHSLSCGPCYLHFALSFLMFRELGKQRSGSHSEGWAKWLKSQIVLGPWTATVFTSTTVTAKGRFPEQGWRPRKWIGRKLGFRLSKCPFSKPEEVGSPVAFQPWPFTWSQHLVRTFTLEMI